MQKVARALAKYWEYTATFSIFNFELLAKSFLILASRIRMRMTMRMRMRMTPEIRITMRMRMRRRMRITDELQTNFQNDTEKNFNITASSELPQEAASMKQNGSFRRRSLHSIEDEIFNEKLVRLLLQRHFALAASYQLLAHEAWKKYREASKKTVFEKWKDKALPHQLRREQLDCKDLRSASFRALCPTSFEHNSFKESTFNEETFKESHLQRRDLQRRDLQRRDLQRRAPWKKRPSQRAA